VQARVFFVHFLGIKWVSVSEFESVTQKCDTHTKYQMVAFKLEQAWCFPARPSHFQRVVWRFILNSFKEIERELEEKRANPQQYIYER